jgi:hypothetical protein
VTHRSFRTFAGAALVGVVGLIAGTPASSVRAQSTTERDTAERDTPERDAPERDAPERDAPERDAPERDAPERDAAQEVETSRRATARALFREGLELAEEDQWETAADRFRRALALEQTAPIRFNFAQSLTHLGKLVEAREQLQRILRDHRASARVRREAKALKARLDDRVGRLAIHLHGPRDGVVVELDGQRVPEAALEVYGPVDPGRHGVTATREGRVVDRESIEVPEGERASVSLEVPEPEPAAGNEAAGQRPERAVRSETTVPTDAEATPRSPDAGRPLVGPLLLGAVGLATTASVLAATYAARGCDVRSVDGTKCLEETEVRVGPTVAYAAVGLAITAAAVVWLTVGGRDHGGQSPEAGTLSFGIGGTRLQVRRTF